jgi:hypothetical protein
MAGQTRTPVRRLKVHPLVGARVGKWTTGKVETVRSGAGSWVLDHISIRCVPE